MATGRDVAPSSSSPASRAVAWAVANTWRGLDDHSRLAVYALFGTEKKRTSALPDLNLGVAGDSIDDSDDQQDLPYPLSDEFLVALAAKYALPFSPKAFKGALKEFWARYEMEVRRIGEKEMLPTSKDFTERYSLAPMVSLDELADRINKFGIKIRERRIAGDTNPPNVTWFNSRVSPDVNLSIHTSYDDFFFSLRNSEKVRIDNLIPNQAAVDADGSSHILEIEMENGMWTFVGLEAWDLFVRRRHPNLRVVRKQFVGPSRNDVI